MLRVGIVYQQARIRRFSLHRSWALTVRLVPQNAVLKSSLLFNVMVKTRYAVDGTLLTACVAGQPDCDIGAIR